MQLIKLSAIGGFLGAATMIAGDVLLYAHWGEAIVLGESMSSRISARSSILLASETHLDISALLGVIAVVGYSIGGFHIYHLFNRDWKIWGTITGSLFAFASLLGGTYHALWSMYGKALQFAVTQPQENLEVLNGFESTLNLINSAATVPLMLSFSILLIAVVWGKTIYPRASVLLTPMPLIFLSGFLVTPLSETVSSPYDSLIKGTTFNLTMMVFFTASFIQVILNDRTARAYQYDAA